MTQLVLAAVLWLPVPGLEPCVALAAAEAVVVDAVDGPVARLADGRACLAGPAVREGARLDGAEPRGMRRRVGALRRRLDDGWGGDLGL